MSIGGDSLNPPLHFPFLLLLLFTTIFLNQVCLNSANAVCELSITDDNKLYNYSLASPIPKFPHGILSEDGFYKVAVNDTVLWFQPCRTMIFNHNPPICVDCTDCGGPLRCGMGCSALVANNIEGYHICNTIGHPSSTVISLLDEKSPHKGVIIKMSSSGQKLNCSLSVSVICDSNGVQPPCTLDKVGICDYVTLLRHPSGCAEVVSVQGKGWGWFSILVTTILCIFGAYLLAGAVYRYFFHGIRGIDIIPNLEFWASLPHSVQSMFMSLLRRFRGPSRGYRSSYSPVNF